MLLVTGFYKNQVFSLFVVVKRSANYEEIVRVGNLRAGFQQDPIVLLF